MRRWIYAAVSLSLVATIALAQQYVNQGRPNTGIPGYGPWPVTGIVGVVGIDGGYLTVIAIGPDGGGVFLSQPVRVVGADGGNVRVDQGSFPWLVAGADGGALNVNIVGLADGGALNVNVTNTVNVAGIDGGALAVNIFGPDGGVVITTSTPAVSTASDDGSCPSGAASFTVKAANSARRAIYMWADPSNSDDVFVKLGTTATSSDARLTPGQALNYDNAALYTGRVDAFPASGTQGVCVIEL